MTRGPVLLCCSALAGEVRSLAPRRWPGAVVLAQDSMLHMRPDELGRAVAAALDREEGTPVLLVYGDCAAALETLEERPGIDRVRALNCCELLLGRDAYRRRSREGAFFLLPEWARRWRSVFEVELGLSGCDAASLMREMHRTLVYLDTGVGEVPTGELAACSEAFGLPLEILPVTLDALAQAVDEGLRRLGATGTEP